MAEWNDKFAKYCAETANTLNALKIEKSCKEINGGVWTTQMCYIDGKIANLVHCPASNDATHLQVRYILNRNCQGFIVY